MVKFCLIGHYPPPYGGESVELQGIRDSLLRREVDCEILNIGPSRNQSSPDYLSVKGALDYFKQVFSIAKKGTLIHIITNGHSRKSWLTAFAVSFASRFHGRRTLLTLGSGDMPTYVKEESWIWKKLLLWILKGFNKVIVRNEIAFQTLSDLGLEKSKLREVAPYAGELTPNSNQIPKNVKDFQTSHSPLLVSAITYFDPEYGFKLTLEAMNQLKSTFPKIGIVLLCPEVGRDTAQIEIDKKHLADQVLLAQSQDRNGYLAILSQSNLFLRATFFDGDASSVREALALKIPALVSRTDFRPEGSVLFEIGNLEDLTTKATEVLKNPGDFILKGEIPDSPSARLKNILNIYHEVIQEAGISQDQTPKCFQEN